MDLHGYIEVIYELCVPHFYRDLGNILIINQLNILHGEVNSESEEFDKCHHGSCGEHQS